MSTTISLQTNTTNNIGSDIKLKLMMRAWALDSGEYWCIGELIWCSKM